MRVARIDDVAEVNPAPLNDPRSMEPTREVPFLPMSAVSEEGDVRYDEVRQLGSVLNGYTPFNRGDVLVAKITPCFENGKAAHLSDLPGGLGFGSTEFHVLRAGPEIEPRFLYHLVRNPAFRKAAAARMTGSAGQRRVPARVVGSWKFPLPPLPEQRRIAAILDRAHAIRRKRQESLKLIDDLLRSTFLEMFGDPVRNERGWEVVRLGELAEVERGKFTPRPRNDPQYYGGAHPFIQTGDIARSEGTLKVWQQTLNEAGAAVSRNFSRGSIAVAIAANIGDTAIVDFDFCCPDSVVVVTPRAGVKGEYLEYCLRFFKPVLESAAPQTAQRNINLGVLRPLRLPVAPLTLQCRFRSAWHQHSRIRVALQTSADTSTKMLNALSHAAFSGQL